MSRSKLSDFEMLSRLGSGSFGTVFKVKRFQDGLLYVIKNVRIVELSYKEQTEAINEVQILSQLKSPFVVRYFDSFIENDALHIVMEFCNRGDLQNLIKKAKDKNVSGLIETVIWNISLQIMLGLYYLHKKNILHRDLKSANVFLMKDETKSYYSVKIGDLGVAKLMDTSTALANTIVGTPYYLSPELCADMPYRDKSDCWAMGVLIYECATLQHPFEARNQCALILKIIEAQVKPPSVNNISLELHNLILWLLQKDPELRPSVKDILNDKVIRDQLKEHKFDLPEELLLDMKITDILRTPNLENIQKSLKKKVSNLQMLANLSHDEHYNIITNTTSAIPTTVISKREKEIIIKPPVPSIISQPTTTTSATTTIIENNITNTSSPKSYGKVLKKVGSNSSNKDYYDMKQDNYTSTSNPQQPQASSNLEVSGNGLGPNNKVNNNNVNASRMNSNNKNNEPLLSGGVIRGSRVRGPAFQNRTTSDKALTRYQIKPPPSTTSIVGKGITSGIAKNSTLVHNTNNDYRRSDNDDKINDTKAISNTSDNDYNEDNDTVATPLRSYDILSNIPEPILKSSGIIRSNELQTMMSDDKDELDYDNEDFEEYEGDDNASIAIDSPAPKLQPSFSNRPLYDTSTTEEVITKNGNSFHYIADDKLSSNTSINISRQYLLDKDSRMNSKQDDYNLVTEDDVYTDLLDFHSSRLLSTMNERQPSSFMDTDENISIQLNQSSVVGDLDPWEPVWTQRRGVIQNNNTSNNITNTTTSRMNNNEVDKVAKELVAMNVYREDIEGKDSDNTDNNFESRLSDISDEDIESLLGMIDEARIRSIISLGDALFRRVYDLCFKQMNEMHTGASQSFVQELDHILYEEGSEIDMHVACEAVVSIKILLALESKYNNYIKSKRK